MFNLKRQPNTLIGDIYIYIYFIYIYRLPVNDCWRGQYFFSHFVPHYVNVCFYGQTGINLYSFEFTIPILIHWCSRFYLLSLANLQTLKKLKGKSVRAAAQAQREKSLLLTDD